MDFTKLKAGEIIYYTGTLYTARDAAHKRMSDFINEGKEIGVDFTNSLIYYAGPTPTKPGEVVGSIGPTTSARMDNFVNIMKPLNVVGMIGKGPRDKKVLDYCKEFKMVYLVATGGTGALLSKKVTSCKEVAFFDLGCESIKKLEVVDFPLIVAFDTFGNSIFERKN